MAISRRQLGDGEQVLLSTRTHVKALFLPVVVLLVVAGLAGYLSSLPDGAHARIWLIVIWVVAGALLVWFVVAPFLRWLVTTYTLTDRRLITRAGVLTRRGHDIPLNRISDVSYEKGILDRILGCGTLVISDASETGRVELHDIPRVEQAQLRLSEELFRGTGSGHRTDRLADDGT